MRISLDAHSLLWLLAEPSRLSRRAQDAITEPANDVFVSAVVVWELVIKLALGKLRLPDNTAAWLPAELSRRELMPLAVNLSHVLAVEQLPLHHRDPFDRLLIAQARIEDLTLVTHDRLFRPYQVPLIWT